MTKPITPEQVMEMRVMRANGTYWKEIAAAFGIHRDRARYLVNPPNKEIKNAEARRREKISRMRKMRADGHTYLEIAEAVGVAPDTVQQNTIGVVRGARKIVAPLSVTAQDRIASRFAPGCQPRWGR